MTVVSSACCVVLISCLKFCIFIPLMFSFMLILCIKGSKDKTYKNIDKGQPCLTLLSILKVSVNVPLI